MMITCSSKPDISLLVTLCLVLDEWPRVGNGPGSEIRTVILPCLRRIVQIAHH
jgi:hypothetical protein